MEQVTYLGLPHCYRLTNDVCEVVVTTDVGPRVARYARHGADNMFGEVPDVTLTTALGDWKPWAGHRLWHAPEAMPRSYAPDNAAVAHTSHAPNAIRLRAPVEPQVGLQKELLVTLAATGSGVTVEHRITNHNLWPVELAPWGITILRGGGEVIIPQEPFRTWAQALLPARPVVVWHYTDMSDPRLTYGRQYLRLRTDAARDTPQKIGVCNKQGWVAYRHAAELYLKRFDYEPGAAYPDYGCNVETYTAGNYIELETLAPLRRLDPGATATHVERWFLFDGVSTGLTETAIAETLAPLLAQTNDAD